MDPATLYLIYVAAAGGIEKKVVEHFDNRVECEEKIARWQHDAQKSGRYTVSHATCLTPAEYNAKIGVFTTDVLDKKHRP